MIARVALSAFLLAFVFALPARAQRCGPSATEWVSRCAKSAGAAMTLSACPPSIAIVEVAGAPSLRVEISSGREAFRKVGNYGLSPIGSFDDWSAEPAATRSAFEAVVRCVEREAPEALLNAADRSVNDSSPRGGAHHPKPYLVLAALVVATVAFATARRPPLLRRVAIAALALFVAIGFRAAIARFAFFHQNGQGPYWITQAVLGDAGQYGPGYPEMFHEIVARASRPDRAIAWAQLLLGAAVPLLAYVLARSVGAARTLAVAVSLGVLVDPVLVRTSRSESYFATMTALLFAAAAALAMGDRAKSDRPKLTFALASVVAGLLIAQAARVHPVAWVPCATVPLVLLCVPGDLGARVRRTATAAAMIAVVATPWVLPAMRNAVSGELGNGFLGGARIRVLAFGPHALVALIGSVGLLGVRSLRRFSAPVIVLVLVAGVAITTNVLERDAAVVSSAYLHLFAPACVAAIAALLASLERPHASSLGKQAPALAMLSLLAAALFVRGRAIAVLPTDAMELDWWLQLREALPSNAVVASVERAEKRMLVLPLGGAGLPQHAPIHADGRTPPGVTPTFYYRSSLCSTVEVEPVCAKFESSHHLRVVQRRSFPGRASLPWLPLPAGAIETVLYAVE